MQSGFHIIYNSQASPYLLLSGAFHSTYGPLLFLYIRAKKFSINKKKLIWHFLPFFIIFVLEEIIKQYQPIPPKLPVYKQNVLFPKIPIFPLPVLVYKITNTVSTLFYIYLIIKTLITTKTLRIGHSYRYVSVLFSFFIINALLLWFPPVSEIILIRPLIMLIFTLLVYYQVFLDLFESFSLKNQPTPEITEYEVENRNIKKYKLSGLKDDSSMEIVCKILNYMKEEKPYLNPDFSLDIMAKNLEVPKYHLSQVLNEKMQTNFYTFVNDYRLREVILELEKNPHLKINFLHLALEKGFPSKATFNRTFKKQTGESPSQFKKKLQI